MKNVWRFGILIVVLLGLFLAGFWKWTGATFVPDVPAAAAKLIASLIVITLLIERSIAAISSVIFQPEKRSLETKARETEGLIGRRAFLDDKEAAQMAKEIAESRQKLATIAGEEDKNRAILGFAFALLVCAAGVRTLSSLLQIDPSTGTAGLSDEFQRYLAHGVDVILTAGLIAGGSDGLAKLLQIIKDGMTPPPKPLQ